MQPAHKYLSNLTTLRGVAAIWVIVYHFEVLICLFVLPQQSLLIEKGYLMVDLFFIMSGFIICHVYQQKFSGRYLDSEFRKVYSGPFCADLSASFFYFDFDDHPGRGRSWVEYDR